MVIICGSFYDENNQNTCIIIFNEKVYSVKKIHQAPHSEHAIIEDNGMVSGDTVLVFGTEDDSFRFGILICFDYYYEAYKMLNFQYNGKKGVDLIIVPSINDNLNRFQNAANSDSVNYNVDILKISPEKSLVYGIVHKKLKERLVNEGLKLNNNEGLKQFFEKSSKTIE